MNATKRITQINSLLMAALISHTASAAPLALYQSPLFLTTTEKPNVLVILDNSNSMDEAANGSAVGSADPTSKSEIARTAVKNLITNYTGKINMGLMAYQQAANQAYNLDNSPYDMSFDPANYDPAFTGSRDSATKRFRVEKPDDLGNYMYYNVALPYYYSGSAGTTLYCWSSTVVDLTSTPVAYRCFEHKTGTSDAQASSAGYSNHQYDATFGPTDSDLAQGITSFGTRLASFYVSPTWFANSSPGRGFLHTFIDELDGTQAATLNTKLAVSQFATNAPESASWPLQNAGLTPLQGTLLSAKDYFNGVLPAGEHVTPAVALPQSCGKDFIALLTDGLPSTDNTGAVTTDPVVALADVATAAGLLNTDSVETYMIGFAMPVGTDPTALDAIANAGGTFTAYMADDPATLQTAFDAIFSDILAKAGASSSAATNSTSLSANSYVYQARFNSGDWSGQLLAKEISTAGIINPVPTWDAAVQLAAKTATSRAILTYGRDTSDGIPFRWSNIAGLTDTTAMDALNADYLGSADGNGSFRVDFLRGGTGSGTSTAFRSDRNGKLGDVIHSTPYYVGVPSAGYNDADMAGYLAFYTAQASRTPIIYSGANDGMMHGFNASTGEEVLAYIPQEVFPNLSRLTALGYGSTVPHQYYVDGSPAVADAYINSNWKTVLAGGLNAGGQGVYALDITNPGSFSEANAANIVLWEFTDEDDADLGYTYFEPVKNQLTNQSAQIAKMANGKWAVIIGNGYNNSDADGHASATGHAYLYILYIEQGTDGVWTPTTDYIKIDTGVGSTATPNGLATPTPIDKDGDGDIDTVYAGDLEGNLWKFDVSSSTPGNWGLALTASKPLFTAKDSSNNPQPITSAPLVTTHPHGGFLVSFGTGKYIELADSSSTATQSVYGIWDEEAHVNSRSSLQEQTVINTQTLTGIEYRVNSDNAVNYPTKKGWFFDLPETGERIDVNPVIRDGRLVYVSRTPTTVACESGGKSWVMEFDYLTGGRLDLSPFDVNNDGVINNDDYVTVTINGSPVLIPVTGRRVPLGGMIATPTVLKDTLDRELKIMASSNGSISSVKESVNASYSGRLSWEEMR